jgi:hypothetical protein
MSNSYSYWLGRKAVLHINTGESCVPLPAQLVNESSKALRVRLDGRWEVDIPKEMIVGMEVDSFTSPELISLGTIEGAPAQLRRRASTAGE